MNIDNRIYQKHTVVSVPLRQSSFSITLHPLPSTSIQHPSASIQHPFTSIQHPSTSIQHPSTSIQHPSNIHPNTSHATHSHAPSPSLSQQTTPNHPSPHSYSTAPAFALEAESPSNRPCSWETESQEKSTCRVAGKGKTSAITRGYRNTARLAT